jgi:hypothetical protein
MSAQRAAGGSGRLAGAEWRCLLELDAAEILLAEERA